MPKLKEGIVVRPFGPGSELKGEIPTNVANWLKAKKLVTAKDFEKETSKKEVKQKTEAELTAEAAAKAAAEAAKQAKDTEE